MTHVGIASALVAAVFALGAITIALCGGERGARTTRELWRVYFSTVIIVTVILLPAVLHPALFAVLVTLAAVRCSVELAAIHGIRPSKTGTLGLIALMLAATWAGSGQNAHDTTLLMSGSFAIIALASPAFKQALAGPARGASIWIVAIAFPALAAAHLCHLVYGTNGVLWIFLLYATVETQDSFAFLFGRLLGRRQLWPKLSPHKTVEGALAGAGFGIAMGIAISAWLLELPIEKAGAVAALLVVAGFAGDMFTSRLKRMAGVKDFPAVSMLHGGLTDIYDSTLFAALPLSTATWLMTAHG